MSRRFILTVALALGTFAVVAAPPAAEAGRRGDALASAAKSRSKEFRNAAKDAEKTFAGVVAGLTKGLASGATSTEDAATQLGNALGFFASRLHEAAGDSSLAFAGDSVQALGAAGSSDVEGSQAGDGGSADAFAEAIRKDLAKFRAKTLKRIAKFQGAFGRADGQRGGLRVVLEDWTFQQRHAPDVGGAADPLPEPVRLWGSCAARLSDGRIVVSVFGSAGRDRDEQFDVRVARGFDVRPMGDFIRDGGMDVSSSGWWSATRIINDPFSGDTVQPGNAQVHFGVEPDETQEPTRLEHAGILSIP